MNNINKYIVVSVTCERCECINDLWSDYNDTLVINDLENELRDDLKNGGWTTQNEDKDEIEVEVEDCWLCPRCTKHLINLEFMLE